MVSQLARQIDRKEKTPLSFEILLMAEENRATQELCLGLSRKGYGCSVISDGEQLAEGFPEADAIVLDEDKYYEVEELLTGIKRERRLPIIVLLSHQALESFDGYREADDFIIKPCNLDELAFRIRRLLRGKIESKGLDNKELIKCGDLVIDLAKYEVSVGGRLIELTFKEYELLKFLASNPGRVFTRDVLLNKVWGYDYFGGDRTVDVHIRRLRSKIEDFEHSFIETVRNIGYRFKKEG